MKVRVLLVDDELEFIDPLAQRLDARGFAVDTAVSADLALCIIKEKELDVVILDVLMPGKSGIEALKEIKQEKPLVEVIMLTGHATVETAIQGMKLGAFDYLMKPINIDDLVEKIKKSYARKSEHEERIRQATISKITRERSW